jgi:hypothetical protein
MGESGGIPHSPGSMNPYTCELFQQCFAATEAWNRAGLRLTNVPVGGPETPTVAGLQIVADLQGFAVAVEILSDLFFPTGKGDAERGRKLRELYDVKPNSPLSGANVRVRHALVHVGERMDRWLKSQVGRRVGPVAIEPWDGAAPPMEESSHVRIADNVGWRLMVLGEKLDLLPLLREVGRIGAMFPLEVEGSAGKTRIQLDVPR